MANKEISWDRAEKIAAKMSAAQVRALDKRAKELGAAITSLQKYLGSLGVDASLLVVTDPVGMLYSADRILDSREHLEGGAYPR